AKEIVKKSKIVLIHCGQLNEGHLKLKMEYGWNILSAKNSGSIENYEPEVVFIDEVQRFRPEQLEKTLNYIQTQGIRSILSIDPDQTLGVKERAYHNKQKIIEYVYSEVIQFQLSD